MKVLVAIDNKPSSQAILDALVKMRWYEGTELHLVSVVSDSEAEDTATGELPSSVQELEGLVVELHNALPQCEVSFLVKHGDPKTVILESSEHLQAELIVIGSNCKNTLERLLIGSVCQSVLNSARCPVIVAKTPCSLAREESPAFKTVLIPIDHSIYSDAAVRWLSEISWSADTKFVLVAVVEYDTDLFEVQDSLNKRALELSQFLQTHNIVTEVVVGEPVETIIELSKKHYSDLIVMGSHGRTGLKKLILGSVSQAVSQKAPCAVAIVTGIVSKDDGWHRTGAFHKVKLPSSPGAWSAGSTSSPQDISSHVMPGGF
jgi:nucleotide-binding universal stress UspA family protein